MQNFNSNFTDEDAAMLLDLQCAAREPTPGPLPYLTGQTICSSRVLGHDLSEHLRSYHPVIGPDKAPLKCCWSGCFAEMRKESLMRHVQEKHLEWRYTCPSCPEQFTRSHTMQNHVMRKHPGS